MLEGSLLDQTVGVDLLDRDQKTCHDPFLPSNFSLTILLQVLIQILRLRVDLNFGSGIGSIVSENRVST